MRKKNDIVDISDDPGAPTGLSGGAALASVVAGAAILGLAAISMRMSEVAPTAAAFWRVALAVPVLLAWLWATDRSFLASWCHVGDKDGRSLLASAFFFFANLALWHWSVDTTTVVSATLIANMAPVFTTILAWLIFRERVRPLFLVGLLLAIMGTTVLVSANVTAESGLMKGDIVGLFNALAYGAYILASNRARRRFTTAQVMFVAAVGSALLLLPVALADARPFLPPMTLGGWLPLIGLALLVHLAGQGLIVRGLAALPASFGSIALLVQPLVTAVLGWLIFAEILGPQHLAGAVLVVAGILVARRAQEKTG